MKPPDSLAGRRWLREATVGRATEPHVALHLGCSCVGYKVTVSQGESVVKLSMGSDWRKTRKREPRWTPVGRCSSAVDLLCDRPDSRSSVGATYELPAAETRGHSSQRTWARAIVKRGRLYLFR